jgi:hypothetical protein
VERIETRLVGPRRSNWGIEAADLPEVTLSIWKAQAGPPGLPFGPTENPAGTVLENPGGRSIIIGVREMLDPTD